MKPEGGKKITLLQCLSGHFFLFPMHSLDKSVVELEMKLIFKKKKKEKKKINSLTFIVIFSIIDSSESFTKNVFNLKFYMRGLKIFKKSFKVER